MRAAVRAASACARRLLARGVAMATPALVAPALRPAGRAAKHAKPVSKGSVAMAPTASAIPRRAAVVATTWGNARPRAAAPADRAARRARHVVRASSATERRAFARRTLVRTVAASMASPACRLQSSQTRNAARPEPARRAQRRCSRATKPMVSALARPLRARGVAAAGRAAGHTPIRT